MKRTKAGNSSKRVHSSEDQVDSEAFQQDLSTVRRNKIAKHQETEVPGKKSSCIDF